MTRRRSEAENKPDQRRTLQVGPALNAEEAVRLVDSAGAFVGATAIFSSGSSESQVVRLGNEQLQNAQRYALADRIGRLQGNHHLQAIIAARHRIEPGRHKHSPASAGLLQRAMPLPESDLPQLSAIPDADRQAMTTLVAAYRADRSAANGQAAVNSVVQYLESQGVIHYTGQTDIEQGSPEDPALGTPEFRLAPSSRATTAFGRDLSSDSGCQYAVSAAPPMFKVEIFPRAMMGNSDEESLAYLIGILVHEFIHIEQGRREAQGQQTTVPEREFQAWLWQAEHVAELGINYGTEGYRQIILGLQQYFGEIPSPDATIRKRYARAMFLSNLQQAEWFISNHMPMPSDFISNLTQRINEHWGNMANLRTPELNSRRQAALAQLPNLIQP
ncbi:MAG: hypothetical protein JXA78_11830 [Anaerolineales bacterium]|nr:hypothetical protein [Anaerolineales bacterium]